VLGQLNLQHRPSTSSWVKRSQAEGEVFATRDALVCPHSLTLHARSRLRVGPSWPIFPSGSRFGMS